MEKKKKREGESITKSAAQRNKENYEFLTGRERRGRGTYTVILRVQSFGWRI